MYNSKHTVVKACVAGFFTFGLMACGGGGGGGASLLSESQIVDRGNQLISDFGSEPPTSLMPTAGSFSYAGVGAASPFSNSPEGIVATATSVYQVEADVDFDTGNWSGSAFNFQSTQPGITFEGSIPVSGVTSGSGFTGSFSGTLEQEGTTVSYTGNVSGDFVGNDAAAMIGTGAGIQSAPGFVSQVVYNYWGAERQ